MNSSIIFTEITKMILIWTYLIILKLSSLEWGLVHPKQRVKMTNISVKIAYMIINNGTCSKKYLV